MKTDVMQLVRDISNQQTTEGTTERFYREVVYDLGRREWMTNIGLVSLSARTGAYTPPADVIRLLGVFYDDEFLSHETRRTMELYDFFWKDAVGTPVAYVTEDETTNTFRLFPAPDVASKSFIFAFGAPLGVNYPGYSAAVVYTENRQNWPAWADLPLAFDVLAREYEYPSAHRDAGFAGMCRQVAEFLYKLVG